MSILGPCCLVVLNKNRVECLPSSPPKSGELVKAPQANSLCPFEIKNKKMFILTLKK